jgi:radical SAM superfamily enzyme YgiQ (UPF0313 family)
VSKKAFIPPLGLLTVAALLPKTWRLKLVDLNVSGLKEKDIQWADYVFLSAMEIQQASVKEIITRVKAQGKKIVGGGPLFTICPERFPELDHLVLYEAEATLPSFIEDLKKGEAKHIYTSTEWPDIEFSPNPEWSLLDFSKYAVMNVQYSRGCPFDCEFCDISLLNGNTPRTKTSKQILRELDTLYQKGWRGVVFFGDDNFIGKPEKLKKEVLPALIKWLQEKRYPFSFLTQATINLADDEELMELMVKAGFDSVFVGIETPEEKSLRECHKVQDKGRNPLAAVKKMQRFGLEVTGGFIIGFDNDPPNIFEMQINFIQESGIITAMVGLLNALKGTKLCERLHHEGRLGEDFTGDNTNFSINFIPKMGYQRLLEGYRGVVDTIYSPRYFYKRLNTFLNNYRPPIRGGDSLKLHHIKAFFHSIWALGILGKERFHYWKNLIWTLLRRRRLLPVYVRLAIYGYHFRKVFQTQLENFKPRSDWQPSEGLGAENNDLSRGKEKTREKEFFEKNLLPGGSL